MRLMLTTVVVAALSVSGAAVADEQLEMGKNVFIQASAPPCTVCHTLNDAGSAGQVGPNLDSMAPSQEQVYAAVTQGVGIMPAYGGTLSEEQRQAVAYYVSQVAGQ
ncbi:MAG: SorU family sulfite dehydrogenase c-type cytochrome subunit [Saccharospirillum sp.]